MPAPAVLIVSSAPLIAALLGTLIEIEGFEPLFPRAGETARAALDRTTPRVVLIDCDDGFACEESFFQAAAERGARALIFSHSRLNYELASIAARHGVPYFALPIDRSELARKLVRAVSAREPGDSTGTGGAG